jgi:hypothetical protein
MRSLLTAILFSVAYVAIGIVTADFAASTASIQGRTAWRLTAWGASLLVYVTQLIVERVRLNSTTLRTALRASGTVAIAAFALAVAGPVRAHWGAVDQQRALMALLLWPVLAGVPSFLLALGAAAVIGRAFGLRHFR